MSKWTPEQRDKARDENAKAKADRQAHIVAWYVKQEAFHEKYINRHNKG